ncbi:MAG: ATP-binding protein, partial [Xenococcaceae cyanobacterium MO_167.B52]|nr:ATP-binding protein [Xenococcaceae cyanobacterium MO_167.B52]
LIAGIAHEINTPLGAIQASAGDNTKALLAAIAGLPQLSEYLNTEEKTLFFLLLDRAIMSKPLYSSKEKRPLKRQITSLLKERNINNARNIADLLIDIGIYDQVEEFISLLTHPQSNWILDLAYNLACLMGNNQTIITSVEKAAKVVFALKNYARFDHSGEKKPAQIQEGLETVLEIYHNRLKQNIEVLRNYQNIPEISCYSDELIQVWTNLIHNSIQAMEDGGKLTITTSEVNNGIKVEIIDSGCGIPQDVQQQIFEPFFTTKPLGEGSGLGLHISQKIIDKHQGNIAVDSEPGHTRFSVWLPIN